MHSTTATRTSTDSAEATPSRPRIGLLGIMQALYDEMLPGITERQAAYARELGDALAGVADVEVAAPKPIVIDRYKYKQDVQGYLLSGRHSYIYLYDIATKKLERLTAGKVDEAAPSWSPVPR